MLRADDRLSGITLSDDHLEASAAGRGDAVGATVGTALVVLADDDEPARGELGEGTGRGAQWPAELGVELDRGEPALVLRSDPGQRLPAGQQPAERVAQLDHLGVDRLVAGLVIEHARILEL